MKYTAVQLIQIFSTGSIHPPTHRGDSEAADDDVDSDAAADSYAAVDVADYPAMSFFFLCWQIKIQMQISWVGWSTTVDADASAADAHDHTADDLVLFPNNQEDMEMFLVVKNLQWFRSVFQF